MVSTSTGYTEKGNLIIYDLEGSRGEIGTRNLRRLVQRDHKDKWKPVGDAVWRQASLGVREEEECHKEPR